MKKVLRNRKAKKEERAFYAFISPWLVGFVCLTLGPMLFSLYAAFTSWDAVSPPVFTGLKNFIDIFQNDDKFWVAIFNTLYFAVVSVPLNLVVALLLACALNKDYRGKVIFRSLFYLPSVVASVAVYYTWMKLYNPQIGFINHMLHLIGIDGPEWLTDPQWAMPSIIIMTVTFCGSSMLIILAGIQDIPEDLYDAANIDGASAIQKFFKITLPLLSPIIFYNLIMGIIGALQVFAQPLVMTNGGPLNATYVINLHLYNNAFVYYKMGYASGLAWLLFLITFALSAIVMGTSKFWVYRSNNR